MCGNDRYSVLWHYVKGSQCQFIRTAESFFIKLWIPLQRLYSSSVDAPFFILYKFLPLHKIAYYFKKFMILFAKQKLWSLGWNNKLHVTSKLESCPRKETRLEFEYLSSYSLALVWWASTLYSVQTTAAHCSALLPIPSYWPVRIGRPTESFEARQAICTHCKKGSTGAGAGTTSSLSMQERKTVVDMANPSSRVRHYVFSVRSVPILMKSLKWCRDQAQHRQTVNLVLQFWLIGTNCNQNSLQSATYFISTHQKNVTFWPARAVINAS